MCVLSDSEEKTIVHSLRDEWYATHQAHREAGTPAVADQRCFPVYSSAFGRASVVRNARASSGRRCNGYQHSTGVHRVRQGFSTKTNDARCWAKFATFSILQARSTPNRGKASAARLQQTLTRPVSFSTAPIGQPNGENRHPNQKVVFAPPPARTLRATRTRTTEGSSDRCPCRVFLPLLPTRNLWALPLCSLAATASAS